VSQRGFPGQVLNFMYNKSSRGERIEEKAAEKKSAETYFNCLFLLFFNQELTINHSIVDI
jgi:hypothetical protein